MAIELGTLRDRLRDQGYKSNRYDDTKLNAVINRAQLKLCGMADWAFLRGFSQATVTSGDPTISLPPDYWKLVEIDVDGYGYPLAPVDFEELRRAEQNWMSMVGMPMKLYHQQDNPELTPREVWCVWPNPGADYTLNIVYKRRPTTLVGDTDKSIVPDEGEDLLFFLCLIDLHREASRWDAMAEAKGAFGDEWVRVYNSLQREHFGLKTTVADGALDFDSGAIWPIF